MATKIRFIGNIGTYNPQINNIHVGVISEATVPLHNGKLITFCVRGTDAHGLDLAIQERSYLSEAVTVTKNATFPVSLLGELISFSEFAALGLQEGTENVANGSGTRIANASISNGISNLSVGFKSIAFGGILGTGVTIAEMENLLDYDVNEDGVVGELKNIKALIEAGPKATTGSGFAFLDSIKEKMDAVNENLYPIAKWSVISIGVNIAVKAATGKPLVGKKGIVFAT